MSNICPYCGEDAGYNELGYRRLIHPHHQAGSAYWARWYRGIRDLGRGTEIGDLLLATYERRAEAAKASLAKMHEWQRRQKEQREGVNNDG